MRIPTTIAIPLFFAALAVALSFAPSSHATGMSMRVTIGEQTLECAGASDDGTLLAGPDRTPVPPRAAWRLEGDLRTHAHLVRWAPAYTIERVSEREIPLAPDRRWRAVVEVRHSPNPGPKRPRNLQPLHLDWTAGVPAGSIAIAAWMVDGHAIESIPLALVSKEPDQALGFGAEFRLTDDAAARGQPVLLLWHDGRFMPPAPLFDDAAALEALVAIRFDDADALARALAAGVRPDFTNRDGLGLVHYAAEAGAARCLALLLRREPRLANLPDRHDWVPLQHAAALGRLPAVRALVAAKARVNTGTRAIQPPLIQAIRHGHDGVVAALLDARATAEIGGLVTDPIDVAISQGHAHIAELLHSRRMKYDFKSARAGRQLLLAAAHGHLGVVRWLVARGTDPNAESFGTTALALAANKGGADSARALIAAGADVNLRSRAGITPLMAAAQYGNVEYAKALIAAGADIRATTESGGTALHLAARADATAMVELLLDHGALIDARTRSGISPLDGALLNGAASAARLLAARGATIDITGPAAEETLAAAVRSDVFEPIRAALDAGWPADSTFAGVWPAVRVAEIFRSERCREALLAAGAPAPDENRPQPVVLPRDLDKPVSLARATKPVDPRETYESFPEMVVNVSVLIDGEGRPLFPRIESSPDPRLSLATMEAIRTWRFDPPRRGGQPVAVRARLPVPFAASEKRVHELGQVSQPPMAVKQSPPAFPLALKKAGITGRADIGFIVDAEGRVRDVEVINATHPLFAEAAAAAISQWEFKPATIDGSPVACRMRQAMSFTLSD